MESEATPIPRSTRAGRLGGALGLVSAALLYSSFRWVHDWGPVSTVIVAGWLIATVAALAVAIFALRGRGGSRRLAKLGLWLALVSIGALALTGIASAAGLDELPNDCGGG